MPSHDDGLLENYEKRLGVDNSLKAEQLHMLPIPEKGMRNEKFIYFYRPYNFKILTRKFMHFDGLDGEHELKEQTKTNLIEYS